MPRVGLRYWGLKFWVIPAFENLGLIDQGLQSPVLAESAILIHHLELLFLIFPILASRISVPLLKQQQLHTLSSMYSLVSLGLHLLGNWPFSPQSMVHWVSLANSQTVSCLRSWHSLPLSSDYPEANPTNSLDLTPPYLFWFSVTLSSWTSRFASCQFALILLAVRDSEEVACSGRVGFLRFYSGRISIDLYLITNWWNPKTGYPIYLTQRSMNFMRSLISARKLVWFDFQVI